MISMNTFRMRLNQCNFMYFIEMVSFFFLFIFFFFGRNCISFNESSPCENKRIEPEVITITEISERLKNVIVSVFIWSGFHFGANMQRFSHEFSDSELDYMHHWSEITRCVWQIYFQLNVHPRNGKVSALSNRSNDSNN